MSYDQGLWCYKLNWTHVASVNIVHLPLGAKYQYYLTSVQRGSAYFYSFETNFQGRKYRRISLNTDSDAKGLAELRDLCDEGREKMIENLADVDENLADKVLAEEGEGYPGISPEMIQKVC